MKSLGASYKCKDCQDIYRLKGKEAFDTVVIVHVEICEDCIEEYT